MSEYNSENNNILLAGEIITDLEFNHRVHGEGFYSFLVGIERLSKVMDKICVIISERLLIDYIYKKGDIVEIKGQFRSYNNYSGEGNRLVLTAFVRNIRLVDKLDSPINTNQVQLNGYICKKPIFRTTPFGREIADILLAVNRSYNKSDYIPCIAWGRNARFVEELSIGDNIKVFGRIQSREYQKKNDINDVSTRTAYEVSVSKLEITSAE